MVIEPLLNLDWYKVAALLRPGCLAIGIQNLITVCLEYCNVFHVGQPSEMTWNF